MVRKLIQAHHKPNNLKSFLVTLFKKNRFYKRIIDKWAPWGPCLHLVDHTFNQSGFVISAVVDGKTPAVVDGKTPAVVDGKTPAVVDVMASSAASSVVDGKTSAVVIFVSSIIVESNGDLLVEG